MRVTSTGFVCTLFLAVGVLAGSVYAEEDTRSLPTLLIKGEVVSLDTTDPSAILLKVKDRYGFETPIFLSEDTVIGHGENVPLIDNLTVDREVEVEYNFDINTAKRYAVAVSITEPLPDSAQASESEGGVAKPIDSAGIESNEGLEELQPSEAAAPATE